MIIVIGAGLVGATLAIRLSQLGFKVNLLERNAFNEKKEKDGRTIAVTLGSKKFLEQCGLWEFLEPTAQKINHIRVFESGSAWTLDYDSKDIGSDPMGYIVEFDCLRNALYKGVINAESVKVIDNCTLQSLAPGEITTKEHGKLKAQLIIGADGKNSWVRSQLNIKSKSKEYGHKALVAHFTHEKPHEATAWEIFQASGPFAVLPMIDTNEGSHQSGVVWCGPKDTPWESIPTEHLESQFMEIFPFYGNVKLNSKRWVFPITGLKVDQVTAKRTILLGDAAHALHPIAGQGVNLGWKDVADLTKLLVEAKELGQDLGSEFLLSKYNQMRKIDHKGMYLFTDGLTRLYQSNNSIVSFFRQTGIAAISKIPPLKKFFMKKAMGI